MPNCRNVVQSDEFNITDKSLRELEPAQLGAGSQPLGDMGQLDALPSELGTLMAGAGSPGSGKAGGVGDAVFFGTRSKGDRFVFVVDNSSSMKGGRLGAAIAELVKTVECAVAAAVVLRDLRQRSDVPDVLSAAGAGHAPGHCAEQEAARRMAAEGDPGLRQESRTDQSDGPGRVAATARGVSAVGRRHAIQRKSAARKS